MSRRRADLRPAEWWEWAKALQELAPNDGCRATGMAWATHCWNWRRGARETDVLASVDALPFADFHRLHRPLVGARTLHRHFAQLQGVGLLELQHPHSRSGPNRYVPRVPRHWTTEAPDDAEQLPLVATAGAEHLPLVATVPPEQLPLVAATVATGGNPPIPSREIQTPPGARASERAGARAREATDGGDGIPEEEEHADRALEEVLRAMPADLAAKVTAKYRRRCRAWLLSLLAAGWRPRDVVQEVALPRWDGVVSPGGALAARLEVLTEQPAPRAPVAPPAKCDRCDVNRMVETDQGQAYCPTCHPLAGRTPYVRTPLPPPASNESRRAHLERARRDVDAARRRTAEQVPAVTGAHR